MNNHSLTYQYIAEHGDGRISAQSLEFYDTGLRALYEAGLSCFFIEKCAYDKSDISNWATTGRSMCVVGGWFGRDTRAFNARITSHSITVVHKDYRNQGIGSRLLKEKIKELHDRFGIDNLVTEVKKTNRSSLRMCANAGLIARCEAWGRFSNKEDGMDVIKFY